MAINTKFVLLLLLLLDTDIVFASSSAQHLYEYHCGACHGNEGDGGVGVPLALANFQAVISDEYLEKTIRIGRPGRVMPAFTQLSDKEVKLIIKYIRGFTTVVPPIADRTIIKGDPRHGRKLYVKKCMTCHGPHGEGGKGTGVTFSRPRDFPIMSPALNNSGFLASASDRMLKRIVLTEHCGAPKVSSQQHKFSDKDVNDIVSYIRSFEKNKSTKVKPQNTSDNLPVISISSSYSVKETVENIKRAAVGKNFRVIRVQTLDNGLVPEGKDNYKQTIVYFCNFEFLNRALAIDPRVGLFLPCRVTVVEQNGKVKVLVINPLRLSKLFNNSELDRYCYEMRKMYLEIIEEATL